MSLTLYYHPLASYCHKVLIALYDSGIPFEKRLIDLGVQADRAELTAIWPVGKFPVIRDHDHSRDIPETSVIIEYLDRFVLREHRLIPEASDDALDVRLWDRFFDNYIHTPMQQIVTDRIRGAKADMSSERSTLRTAYAMADRRMNSRTWVAGTGFSMADCAAAPALFYASTVEPIPDELVQLKRYFERLTERPSFRRVLDEAKPYFSMYPFAESIPARFL
jgi:glutathione S-transferase